MAEAKRSLQVFLCHAHKDKDQVRELYNRLRQDGVDAWLDKENLLPGQDWDWEIRQAVRRSDVVIVCHSEGFNEDGFRQKEVRLALEAAQEKAAGQIFLIPARFEECEILESLTKYHRVDLFEQDGYARLVLALQKRSRSLGIGLTADRDIPFRSKPAPPASGDEFNSSQPPEKTLPILGRLPKQESLVIKPNMRPPQQPGEVFNLVQPKKWFTLKHPSPVTRFVFFPDSTLLLASIEKVSQNKFPAVSALFRRHDSELYVWNTENGTHLGTHLMKNFSPESMQFVDEDEILVAGWKGNGINLARFIARSLMLSPTIEPKISMSSPAAFVSPDTVFIDHDEEEQKKDRKKDLILSPDGSYLSYLDDHKIVRIWHVPRCDLMFDSSKKDVFPNRQSLAFSPDSTCLGFFYNEAIHLWKFHEDRLTKIPLDGFVEGPLVFSAHGQYLAAVKGAYLIKAGWQANSSISAVNTFQYRSLPKEAGRKIGIWRVEDGLLVRTLDDIAKETCCLVFSPDGRYLLSGSRKGTLQLWDLQGGQEVYLPETPIRRNLPDGENGIIQVSFSPDGRKFAASFRDGNIQLWALT